MATGANQVTRRMPDNEKKKIADLIKHKYPDFGPTLAMEKLAELDKIERSRSAIRSIMINEKIWKPDQNKKETHREWRPRKASKGELVQYDGSYEHWFEDRGKEICLLASIDDADSEVWLNSMSTKASSHIQLLAELYRAFRQAQCDLCR